MLWSFRRKAQHGCKPVTETNPIPVSTLSNPGKETHEAPGCDASLRQKIYLLPVASEVKVSVFMMEKGCMGQGCLYVGKKKCLISLVITNIIPVKEVHFLSFLSSHVIAIVKKKWLFPSQGRKETERNPTSHSLDNSAPHCWPETGRHPPRSPTQFGVPIPTPSFAGGEAATDGAWLEEKAEQRARKGGRAALPCCHHTCSLLTLQRVPQG